MSDYILHVAKLLDQGKPIIFYAVGSINMVIPFSKPSLNKPRRGSAAESARYQKRGG